MAIDITAGVLALCPRNQLDLDAAVAALHPPHGVGKVDENTPDGDEFEKPRRGHPVVSRRGLGATRAPDPAVGAGANPGDDDLPAIHRIESDVFINESLERMDGVE